MANPDNAALPSPAARVVILGAGYAGLLCALRLRRRAGAAARITLINARPDLVERIRLHQLAAGQTLPARPLSALLDGTGIELHLGRVTDLDLAARQVMVDGADGQTTLVPYDQLVYALGSATATSVAGVAEHTHRLDGPDASLALLEALRARGGRPTRLAIVGGGLTGIEAATELKETFPELEVQLICDGEVGPSLSARGRAHLRRVLGQMGVVLVEQTAVSQVEAGRLQLVSAATGARTLDFEVALWAAGFQASPLAARAGLATGAAGRILVDEQLRSLSHPEVIAIGDAALPAVDVGAPLAMSCKTAMPMGASAADNLAARLAGRPERPFRFGDTGVCISLGRQRALVQLHRRDGTPVEKIVAGRTAVFLKERISRYTVQMLRLTRHLGGAYHWLRPTGSVALAATAPRLQA